MHSSPYRKLALMAVLSFASMYVLMYMMVNEFENVFPNRNQFYMAGMMTVPMIIIELVLMRGMYPNKQTNMALMAVSVVLGILFIIGIRAQALIGDRQFLKSMIPHHAAAIQMCEAAPLQDPEIRDLCQDIVSSQQGEIDWMKAKLSSSEAY